MLIFLADSTTVGPSPALVIFTIVIVMAICAGVVTAMKGLWIWLIAGLLTTGLAFFYSAFLPPKPGSLWARRTARRDTSNPA
jgi:hypothetical protein